MSIYCQKDTTTRINPRAMLSTCDRCHEHAPRFVTGVGIAIERLCPSCAVAANLSDMHPIAAERLQAALIEWITTPNPALDCDDDTFYARLNSRTWTQRDLDDEAERNARKAWVASVCADPDTRQVDADAAYMAAFWTALIAEAA